MTRKLTRTVRGAARKHRLERGNPRLEEYRHDPYRSEIKVRTPVHCGGCGAVYRAGRWTWGRSRRTGDSDFRCPACRRIQDRYPAGEVTVEGRFALEHEAELVRLVQRVEGAENAEHPLHRIIAIEREPERLRITTTDIHLPRRIGHALEHAWGGQLTTHYDERGYFARVGWTRET